LRKPASRIALITIMLAAVAVVSPGVANAAPPTVTCTKNDWGSGFTVDCRIANPGPETVSGWQVTLTIPTNVTFSGGWNFQSPPTRSGTSVTFRNGSFNGTIAPGTATSFGFQGSPGGWTLGACTINGGPCDGTGTPPTGDTTPPTAPTNLRVTGTTSSTASLSWTASTDNVGVTGYDVLNADTVVASNVSGTTATVSSLIPDTSYTFTVRARDAAGNTSPASTAVTARTQPGTSPGTPGEPTSISTISTGYTAPWGIDWLPDGSAIVTERDTFRVYRVSSTGTRTQLGTVPNVTSGAEGGLMGVAVSPTYATDNQIYLYHTSSSDNRLVRMTVSGNTLTSHTVILSGIPRGSTRHQGGRIGFGPDGFLYIATGDAGVTSNAQNTSSLAGKILRVTRTGTAAPNNPFGNLVYSRGHRNPQGLAWDASGRLWSSELGETSRDELNIITAGGNYGWPQCEGPCSVSGMTNPVASWTTGEASPSGIAVAGNNVYMATLRGQRLWRIPFTSSSVGTPQAYYTNQYGRLRAVTKVPGQNALWLMTNNADGRGSGSSGSDQILRIMLG
jgi:glucose/arabinose dehydrogenase